MIEKLIQLKNIAKCYQIEDRSFQVLKHISLEVEEGDMLAIVGPSGSGKTTLMNIIGLLDKIDKGEYLLSGQKVTLLPEDTLADLRNQTIGFVFQQFNLLPRFTSAQNVALPLHYRKLHPLLIKEKITEVLSKVGMKDYGDHRPMQLSGGQQQRIAIARALVTEPKVILADEPTGALDSKTGQEVMRLFHSLHREGKTIILVTHDENIASQCTRRITLSDGQIVRESRSHELA